MRILRAPQTRIPQIIQPTIRNPQLPDERPDLGVVPVDDGVDAHEARPAAVRGVEGLECRAMGVGAPGADEDGADAGVVGEVVGEGFFHGFGVAGEGEVVGVHGVVDEGVDLGEGVFGDDVDRAEGLGQAEWRRSNGVVGMGGVRGGGRPARARVQCAQV